MPSQPIYPTTPAAAQAALIELLQLAHAGERAAAYAYQGHAQSFWARRERVALRLIEAEEWLHRRNLGQLLRQLQAQPHPQREKVMAWVGRGIALLCHLGGWLIPMYGAGKLESGNIWEYEYAARLAHLAEVPEWVELFLEMAEVEWEHEAYFRQQIQGHWLGKHLPLWPESVTRPAIRQRFAAFQQAHPPRPPFEYEPFQEISHV